jgi:hypothetical protein
MASEHMWVALMYLPIDVEPQENGNLDTSFTVTADDLAHEDAKLCCWNCLTPLTTDTFSTECEMVVVEA